MYQITLTKSTEKVIFFKYFFTVVTAVTEVTVVRTIMQPLHKKILHYYFFDRPGVARAVLQTASSLIH